MDTSTYPRRGLSLPQLAFALNEELKCTNSSFFTLDAVSQLERDISAALVTVRGWKNTFAPINRIPLDILSLIPTHLPSQKDHFRATFVCCHWRKTFLQYGALWSQLFLGLGEDYVATLLERTKGSALEIFPKYETPLSTITLLSPHTRRIGYLRFPYNYWTDVLTFSEVNSGPLPLLRTLWIRATGPHNPHNEPNVSTAPSLPLFSGAVNLETFTLDLKEAGSLEHFFFPNLTTFKLSTPVLDRHSVSRLFNFLKSSPTLRTVRMEIEGGTMPGSISQDMAVVLPNVETFSLLVHDNNDNAYQVYELAVHISCPRAKYVSLTQERCGGDMTANPEIFPDSVSWRAIARKYLTSPVEEVTLGIEGLLLGSLIAYSLAFHSSDAAVIKFGFEADGSSGEAWGLSYEEMHLEIFSQACRTIRDHPLLSHVKRFHIKDKTGTLGTNHAMPMAEVVRDLFGSLGPLDELTIDGFRLQIFLAPFIDLPEFQHFQRTFIPVKKLTISRLGMVDEQLCTDAMVELARSQHELGKPFEHVRVRARRVPTAMVERLREWVSAVDFHQL